MSQLGLKCKVYYENNCIGELNIVAVEGSNFEFPNNEIRIHCLSPKSNRCSPHSVAHMIASSPVLCKLEAEDKYSDLFSLYIDCIRDRQTGVVLLGEEELHLVAMVNKYKNCPCFWCYTVPSGLYSVCLRMLDLRCLWIVFDLDETLIVGNTMRSFRDKIASLRIKIAKETDPVRKSGMFAEMALYEEDQRLLKQYIDRDSVVDSGNVYNVQAEVVKICESQDRIVRPVIRLLDRGIVLTRINPEIRDTSVLARLRPAWEDLRRHLNSKERKRFEVYVCTMAERNYALEMWRLLDPEAQLIDPKQLSARIVSVNSGHKKSLNRVFQDQKFHRGMAMVIDDRLKVWEDIDQPRVQVVPAFLPYRAPLAETANGIPVLCVARNVACNVRGCFFKEFDDNLSRRVCRLFYEDEVKNLPLPPDVSTYMIPEGGWLAKVRGCGSSEPDRQHIHQNSLSHITDGALYVGLSSQLVESKSTEARERYETELRNLLEGSHSSGGNENQSYLGSSMYYGGKGKLLPPSMYVERLQEIGKRCCLEVFFGGQKVGTGRGNTKKDAQQKAAEDALQKLAALVIMLLEEQIMAVCKAGVQTSNSVKERWEICVMSLCFMKDLTAAYLNELQTRGRN
ncbi:RNA polymerase II C-terminal domain phosphatase-like 2 isoform X2 [Daucus carota subsp. sativus]|uniref:RNA polymerase II C-terminal domain phosphatase-like 2 isoform X2 n=1 Tax=Daucus carota subsp. sativus TaxID=79200 RepID=UPI0007F01933|nr:PREDICTED: RNA polymerase II C-terminal domain phosphatase-like 2 isoform X2 [Daucus carota subsp. sativus]